MSNLKKIVEEWKEKAIEKVREIINLKGYITYSTAYNVLEEYIREFTKDYEDIEIFSEEFVNKVYAEYEEKIENLPGVKIINVEENLPEGDKILTKC